MVGITYVYTDTIFAYFRYILFSFLYPSLLLNWMFEQACLDTFCFGCLISMCFVFLYSHFFRAIEQVSHGRRSRNTLIIIKLI